MMNQRLRYLDAEIVDIKLTDTSFDGLATYSHISEATFLRYYLPQYIKEDIVLYLDSDVVVTTDVSHLMRLDLGDHYCAAAYEIDESLGFNAGVILWNLKQCRKDGITEKLLEMTVSEGKNNVLADQFVLNQVFKDRWLPLPNTYNYLTGLLPYFEVMGLWDKRERYKQNVKTDLPNIIHYVTDKKPWLKASVLYAQEWWYYHNLDWSDIYAYKSSCPVPKAFILTNSAHMEQLEHLIQSVPEVDFHIGAYTQFAHNVMDLAVYDNCFIHPGISQTLIEEMLRTASVYLDINHYNEVDQIVSRFHEVGRPVFAFDVTNHDTANLSRVFTVQDVEEMICELKRL